MKKHLAFLFPGQGSQHTGMMAAFAGEAVVVNAFSEASDVLGYDLWSLVRDNPDGRLDQTEYTQPALLTASVAMLRLWRERKGVEAGHVAGHSLGEYSALVAAGSLAFSDAVSLVAFRGRQMSRAVAAGTGRMAAIIGLGDNAVVEACEQATKAGEQVWAANYNCPGQVVIAGHAAAVERAMTQAKAAGAKRALVLAVSAPSHTPLMQPAADMMRERLEDVSISAPDRVVWSNALAAPVKDPAEICAVLVQQLVSPVRWTQIVQRMHAEGVGKAVEMGPGKVLGGLIRRIARDITTAQTETPPALQDGLELAEETA